VKPEVATRLSNNRPKREDFFMIQKKEAEEIGKVNNFICSGLCQ
jgi:hypothetical protein